ncbi:MAG: copper resistance protein CopC [Hyphomicrobiales bacterium]
MKRSLTLSIVLTVLCLFIGSTGEASAHAVLVRSEPAENAFLQRAPAEVTLVFSEPVDARASTIQLLDATGKAVPLPAQPTLSPDHLTLRRQLPPLDPGIYNVLWENVSAVDGHGISGSFPFTILKPDGSVPDQTNSVSGLGSDPDPAPLPEGVAVRALSLFGLLLAVGPAILLLFGVARDDRVRKGMVGSMILATCVLSVATALNFQLIRDVYTNESFGDILFNTRAGGYWMARLGAVLLVDVLATFVAEAPKRAAGGVLFAMLVYIWSYAATSHGAAGSGSAWGTGIDLIHGVAAIVWIGAVIGVALTARMAWRSGHYGELMPRFGLLASVMVFFLIATGILSAFIEVDTWDKLTDTRYGLTLLAKLGLMMVLLAVALYNARWGKARLMAEAPGEPRRFIVTSTSEALLGLGVFVLAAMLTQTSVAKSVAKEPDARAFDQTTTAGGLSVQLQIDPNRTGVNTYRVTLNPGQRPPEGVQRVRLTFRYQDDQTVGPSNLTLSPSGDSAFLGRGPYFTLEGQWRVEVEIRRENADDVTAFFAVRPAGSAVTGVQRGGAWDNPAPGLSWNQFGGIIALLVGLGFALFKGPLWALGKKVGWAANGATAAGFGVGALLLFGVHSHVPTGKLPSNPIFPDENSVSIGRQLYQQNCAACHGQTGVPPEGLDLNPYPLDLTVHVPQHPDGQLYLFIHDGVPGTAMPAWGKEGKLTEDQIWHIVNYLRTLGAVDQ